MAVTPFPAHGSVMLGRDRSGRALRVSSHPEVDRVVLSIWQDDRCTATLRLAAEDVPELVRSLTEALVPPASSQAAAG